MKRRTRFVCILLASLLSVLGLMSWYLSTEARSARLPDGRMVTVRAVSFGKQHHYIGGSTWQRILSPLLTTNLAARLGAKISKVTRDQDVLLCWVEVTRASNGPVVLLSVADEDGRETRQHDFVFGRNLPPDSYLSGHEFWSFPRRSETLILKVHSLNRGRPEHVVQFKIKNPARKIYPVCEPEPLPTTKQAGNDQFTLVALNTGLYATGNLGQESATWTELEFRYGPQDFPTGPWHPLFIEVSDATGNLFQDRDPMQRIVADEATGRAIVAQILTYGPIRDRGFISLKGMLWLDEPAWKVRVEFVRTDQSAFRPEETWTVKGIAVPPPNGYTEVNARTNLAEGTLLLRGISAAYTAYPGERALPEPTIHVKLESAAKGALVSLVKVFDDRGSNVWFASPRAGVSGKSFALRRLSEESKKLDLTFAIHRSRTVEFLAKPTLLHTNIAKSKL